ncbi:MAG: hypothetical protein GWO16_02555, partial [Gammaproteobacteria bacterium]|nr:hypothetical protein [Gammaproteobacteria bacterium]NIR43260.1 hypothetical protein [Gemmatimonadota bacterium]NIR96580.1 hypothetical protein [Gammaproteobacteria bacterium]NIT62718.1 hypothetical protein [Gammaproteobacteria bacterium]NIV19676.1 hypothetical protein [Gammaproteobacteria bacterium]
MTIDWLTVGAQVVNFLILVYLLQHFLYHPIINAMDRREQRIARQIEEAEQREAEAEAEARRLRQRREELEGERQSRLETAEQEAERRRQALLEEAKAEVRRARAQWERDLAREQEEVQRAMRRSAARAVGRISRRVLADLADVDLEQRVVGRFLARLGEMDADTRRAFADASSLTVQTAFAPSEHMKKRLREGMASALGGSVELEFRRSEAVLCGIEISGAGRKLRWSVDQYLDELEDA